MKLIKKYKHKKPGPKPKPKKRGPKPKHKKPGPKPKRKKRIKKIIRPVISRPKKNYRVVLYDHGKRKKNLFKSMTYAEALLFFDKTLKNNVVYFEKRFLWNGLKSEFELALLAPKNNKGLTYIEDPDLGIKIDIKIKGDFVIKKLAPYKMECPIKYKNENKTIYFKDLIRDFIVKNQEITKIITSFGNKVSIEYFENDKIDLFIVKNKEDAIYLNELIYEFCQINGMINILSFTHPGMDAKLKLYEKLEERGYNRLWLTKISTR